MSRSIDVAPEEGDKETPEQTKELTKNVLSGIKKVESEVTSGFE